MTPLLDAAGWVGALALLSAYALVSSGRVQGGGIGFQRVNLVGAGGLAVNSTYHGAWPSVALNAVWLGIGVVALLRLRLGKRRAGRRAACPQAVPAEQSQKRTG